MKFWPETIATVYWSRVAKGPCEFVTWKLVHVEDIASPVVWNLIWKAKAPQRVKVFLWILWKNRLLMNCERVQ
ncbi:hypothetical protein PVK06_042478 [Gossypium arboreum]|uniref:Reverse transcriptase zinc-binding domain-containing protein n=1 Tax=Gossypium arboreum TaxID=29729 RepID=A0ABR0ML79_GOSAR|nr:hypothetical protein PVK06_042478 [Gossypium arboreum]